MFVYAFEFLYTGLKRDRNIHILQKYKSLSYTSMYETTFYAIIKPTNGITSSAICFSCALMSSS